MYINVQCTSLTSTRASLAAKTLMGALEKRSIDLGLRRLRSQLCLRALRAALPIWFKTWDWWDIHPVSPQSPGSIK